VVAFRQLGRPIEVVLAPAGADVARIVGYTERVSPGYSGTDGAERPVPSTSALGARPELDRQGGGVGNRHHPGILGPPGGPGLPSRCTHGDPDPVDGTCAASTDPLLVAHLPTGRDRRVRNQTTRSSSQKTDSRAAPTAVGARTRPANSESRNGSCLALHLVPRRSFGLRVPARRVRGHHAPT